MSEPCLRAFREKDGRLLRLRLSRPKANIVDAQMIAALDAALAEHLTDPKLLAVLLDHEGPHFSFGASVAEHLPDQCAGMLQKLHALVRRLLSCPVPVLVSIKGQCLGGGLEVAMAAHLLFCTPDAKLGQPEIQLGVFAPAASAILPERLSQMVAEDLLLSGRSLTGEEARAAGLVAQTAADPEAAALAYFDAHLAGRSASSLRFAVRAARGAMVERVEKRLSEVERLYLEELMRTHDAVEGITSFVEKRPARWEDR